MPRKFTAQELEMLRDYITDELVGPQGLARILDRPEEEIRYAAKVLGYLPVRVDAPAPVADPCTHCQAAPSAVRDLCRACYAHAKTHGALPPR